MYKHGYGNVVRDDAAALALYRRGAELGDDLCTCCLGDAYESGGVGVGGIEKDAEHAVSLYRRAADRGHAQSKFCLGRYGFGCCLNAFDLLV